MECVIKGCMMLGVGIILIIHFTTRTSTDSLCCIMQSTEETHWPSTTYSRNSRILMWVINILSVYKSSLGTIFLQSNVVSNVVAVQSNTTVYDFNLSALICRSQMSRGTRPCTWRPRETIRRSVASLSKSCGLPAAWSGSVGSSKTRQPCYLLPGEQGGADPLAPGGQRWGPLLPRGAPGGRRGKPGRDQSLQDDQGYN